MIDHIDMHLDLLLIYHSHVSSSSTLDLGRVWFVGSERTCIVGCRVGAFGWPEERRSLAGRMQEVPSGLARGKRPNRPFLLGQARSVQLFTRLMMY